MAADGEKRRELIPLLQELTPATRSALADWSPVMVAATGPSPEVISRFADFHGRMLRLQAVLEEEVSGRLTRVTYEIGDEQWIATRLLGVVMRAQELDVELLDRADQLVPAAHWHAAAFTAS